MKNKYTMEEFEEMFKKAQEKTLEILEKNMKEADTENKMSGMGGFVFSLQNMMCMAELHKQLFKNIEN